MIITKEELLPTNCEFCGSKLTWDGPNLVCSNINCKNLALEHIKAWLTNLAPIDGLGWKTIEKLLNETKQVFNTVFDIYNYAKDRNNRWLNVKENSEKDLFNKMLDKLVNHSIKISNFLLALKIPGLGKIGAESIENSNKAKEAFYDIINFNSETSYFDYSSNIWVGLLQDANVAESLYFDYRKYFIDCFELVKDQIIFDISLPKEKVESKGTVAITGTLNSMKRDDFVKLLNSKGWLVVPKINKNTNYLITNTPNSNTTKNKEADLLGIGKITEKDFISKYIN